MVYLPWPVGSKGYSSPNLGCLKTTLQWSILLYCGLLLGTVHEMAKAAMDICCMPSAALAVSPEIWAPYILGANMAIFSAGCF